ncbi:5-formyltetrahydrofolate cyclo-ligase [Streptomyces sp. NPDC017979]|uniref:5-formyltetrahydrofolate cyclo-ligase n=1 Tax=Streptomyces sp. NPDC017979 TaxID=3365024 RepID=UPI0037888A16
MTVAADDERSHGAAKDPGGTSDGADDGERHPEGLAAAKRSLRRDLLDARARRSPDDVRQAAEAITRHALSLPELTGARTLAAYVSVGREPGTRALLDALRARGVRVLLPVLMADNDLDWAVYEGSEQLARAGRGLLEPAGPRLGPGAVREADAVLLPGLAVDARGMRLGRGGGSYDRVLARLATTGVTGVTGVTGATGATGATGKPRPPGAYATVPPLVVLLYANEVVAHLPEEAHDHPVHAVVTPDGVRRF